MSSASSVPKNRNGEKTSFLDSLSSFFWEAGARGDLQGNSTMIKAESSTKCSTFYKFLSPLPIHYLNQFIQLLRDGKKVFCIIKWMMKPRLRFRPVIGCSGHSFCRDIPRHPSCLPHTEAPQCVRFVPFLLHPKSAVTSQSPLQSFRSLLFQLLV